MSEITADQVKIYVGLEEKIGLPNYSSVTISAGVSRIVEDGTEEHILGELQKLAQGTVEQFIAEERKMVLEMVQSK